MFADCCTPSPTQTTFVLGGTGFLGFHICNELAKNFHKVITYSLEPLAVGASFHKNVECRIGNLFEMTDDEISSLLSSCDNFVYAAGKDERVVPEAPAYDYYHRENVTPTARMARICASVGVKKFVVLSSFFVENALKEKYSYLHLDQEAYPKTRMEQEQAPVDESERAHAAAVEALKNTVSEGEPLPEIPKMEAISLRLPYVFGHTPGRVPLWLMFLDQVYEKESTICGAGKVACVSVTQVAEAVRGAIENGSHGKRYVINGKSLSFTEIFRYFAEGCANPKIHIRTASADQMSLYGRQMDEKAKLLGKEHGIRLEKSILTQGLDFGEVDMVNADILGYNEDDVETLCRESMAEAYAFYVKEKGTKKRNMPATVTGTVTGSLSR